MKKFLIVIAAVALFTSCKKYKVPSCIDDRINDFKTSVSCSDAKVDQYRFQSETLYAFEHGSCVADAGTLIVSSDCTDLGLLNGFGGNKTINGENFDHAVFIKTVWKP